MARALGEWVLMGAWGLAGTELVVAQAAAAVAADIWVITALTTGTQLVCRPELSPWILSWVPLLVAGWPGHGVARRVAVPGLVQVADMAGQAAPLGRLVTAHRVAVVTAHRVAAALALGALEALPDRQRVAGMVVRGQGLAMVGFTIRVRIQERPAPVGSARAEHTEAPPGPLAVPGQQGVTERLEL